MHRVKKMQAFRRKRRQYPAKRREKRKQVTSSRKTEFLH